MRWRSLVWLALTACGPPPDLRYGSLDVWFDGTPRDDTQVERLYDSLNTQAGLLGFKGQVPAHVRFEPGSFHCDTDPSTKDWYNGCQDIWGGEDFQVRYFDPLTTSAFAYEISHLVWERLYGTDGESQPDGGFYDTVAAPDFNAFVVRVNAGGQ